MHEADIDKAIVAESPRRSHSWTTACLCAAMVIERWEEEDVVFVDRRSAVIDIHQVARIEAVSLRNNLAARMRGGLEQPVGL